MSKETIALALPLFIYYVATDLLQQKHIRFWIYSALGGFIVLAIYFLVVWALTGDVLKRFDAIAGNSYLNLCSYDQQPLEFLVQRITSGFFTLLVREGMATSFILIIAHLVRRRSLRFLSMDDSFSFWATSALILLLSSNFMSISLTSYSPMCLDPRHYLFLIPVAAIPAAMAFRDFITHRPYALSALLFMTLTAAIAYNLPEKSFWQLYAPLALLFLLMWLTGAKPSFQHPYLALFVLLLSIQPLYTANYARRINYPRQREVFMEQVLNKPDSAIVITDDIQKRLGQYYAAFSSNSRHTLLNFEEFKYDSTDRRKKILFLNGHTRFMANIADDQKLPLYAQNMSASNPLLYQDTALNIAIYDMRRFTIPEQNGKRLLYSINDFEQAAPYWSQEGHPTSAEVKYQGAYAGQASEFSTTFSYPADSLRLSGFSHFLIRCSAFVNHAKATPAQLVISIEDNTGAYIWKGAAVNPSIRAFSNWWPITHELSLPQSDIKENATLKVYFWNPDKQKAYIDNFWVEVIGYDD
jgi:hypothetical protein